MGGGGKPAAPGGGNWKLGGKPFGGGKGMLPDGMLGSGGGGRSPGIGGPPDVPPKGGGGGKGGMPRPPGTGQIY